MKKIIVDINGGLGNQMFQYAILLKLASYDKLNVEAYVREYSMFIHNGFELEKIFDIRVPQVKGFKKFLSKVFFRKTSIIYKLVNDELIGYVNLSQKLSGKTYLMGYWQSEKYFDVISSEIRAAYSFRPFETSKNKELSKELQKNEYVSIHIRRGDFLKSTSLINLTRTSYYSNAISKIKSLVVDPKFVVFSDDIDWCRKNMGLPIDTIYVDWNNSNQSFRDMQLMTICSHNIISNSTFSWWGAWLNKNPNKIVICPEVFIINKVKHNKDLCAREWIKIGTKAIGKGSSK